MYNNIKSLPTATILIQDSCSVVPSEDMCLSIGVASIDRQSLVMASKLAYKGKHISIISFHSLTLKKP